MNEVDLGAFAELATQHLGLLVGVLDRDAELVNIAEPLVSLSFVDLGLQILPNFLKSIALTRIDLEEVASYACVFVNAVRPVWPVAVP